MEKGPAPTPSLSNRLQDLGARISPTQRLWLVSVGIAAAASLIGNTLIQTPWRERSRQLAARYTDQQQRIELLRALEQQDRMVSQRGKGQLLEGGSPVLTDQISRIAKENKIAIQSVTPQGETALAPYTKHQIEVKTLARIEDLARFLHAIEHHQPFLTVDEMEIDRTRTSAEGPFFSPGQEPRGAAPDLSERNPNTSRRARFLISGYARKDPRP